MILNLYFEYNTKKVLFSSKIIFFNFNIIFIISKKFSIKCNSTILRNLFLYNTIILAHMRSTLVSNEKLLYISDEPQWELVFLCSNKNRIARCARVQVTQQ